MEVRTTLGTDGLLTVEVLSEGGSDYIRTKVLRASLQREQDLLARRQKGHAPAMLEASPCAEPEPDESGLLRVPIGGGPKDGDSPVVGHMFLQPSTGDLVRVAGRLAKNPSFWVSQVDVEWTYAKVVNDIVLPVSLYSIAKVKMFGTLDVPDDLRLFERRRTAGRQRVARKPNSPGVERIRFATSG